MPLHLTHIGHHRSSSRSEDKPPPPSFVPSSPRSPSTAKSIPGRGPERVNTISSISSDTSSQPASILRKPTHQTSTSSDVTGSSTSASAYMSKKMNNLNLAFDRTDTISSLQESDDEDDGGNGGGSTPATSVSSFGNQCPLPVSSTSQKFPFFVMSLSHTSSLSFMALPLAMRPEVLDAIQGAWKKGISKTQQVDYQPELMKRHKDKGCEGGVWEVTMKGEAWVPSSSEKVS